MIDTSSRPGLFLQGSALTSLSTGIQVEELAPLDKLIVHTANSRYEFIVVHPADGTVLFKGGQITREFMSGCIAGSAFDGGHLRPYGVYVGSPMALLWEDQGVLTSRVVAIQHTSASGPH